MRVAIVLHAHQPPTQYIEVTKSIAQKSYFPVIEALKNKSRSGKVTLNLTRSLLEQLNGLGYNELLGDIATLYKDSSIELTTTSAYHALIPHLSEPELCRQIRLQNEALSHVVGETLSPKGCFLPELRYSQETAARLENNGVSWVLLDESAYPGSRLTDDGNHGELMINKNLYTIEDTGVSAFFRDRPMSFMIAFDHSLTIDRFISSLANDYNGEHAEYVVIAVDMETFGYHYHGNMELLNDILNSEELELVSPSDILTLDIPKETIAPLQSTWGMAQEEDNVRIFPRWENPENELHKMQWELFEMALSLGQHKGDQPDVFDKCLHSDQFWWAGGNPCWHPGMVESGAKEMLEAIEESPKSTKDEIAHAKELVKDIVSRGVQAYGDKVIEC